MNDVQVQAALITRQIMQELVKKEAVAANSCTQLSTKLAVPVGISNRHVHLSREDMDVLFGSGVELTRYKAVKQPGQYAADQTVVLRGPKGEIQRVRILGPLRSATQIEISIADSFTLGVKAPLRMSGELDNSAGIEIVGPRGVVKKDHGAIVAWRHIHISPQDAEHFQLSDGMQIDVQNQGARGGILQHVVVRVSSDAVLEMHLDVEEANALGLKNGDLVYGLSKACSHG